MGVFITIIRFVGIDLDVLYSFATLEFDKEAIFLMVAGVKMFRNGAKFFNLSDFRELGFCGICGPCFIFFCTLPCHDVSLYHLTEIMIS